MLLKQLLVSTTINASVLITKNVIQTCALIIVVHHHALKMKLLETTQINASVLTVMSVPQVAAIYPLVHVHPHALLVTH